METRVINHAINTIGRSDYRIMSLSRLSNIAYGSKAPFSIRTQQLFSSRIRIQAIIECITSEDSTRAFSIYIRSIRILASENTHLITTICLKSTISNEKVIIFTDAFNIRTFARNIITTSNLLAEIWIGSYGLSPTRIIASIRHGIITQSRFRIKFQHPNTSRP